MDTQGANDNRASHAGASKLYGLTTLMSSKQLYNIKDNLDTQALDDAKFFAEMSSWATQQQREKLFHDFYFLVRDYKFFDQDDHGNFEAG